MLKNFYAWISGPANISNDSFSQINRGTKLKWIFSSKIVDSLHNLFFEPFLAKLSVNDTQSKRRKDQHIYSDTKTLKHCENINNDESVGGQYRQITHMASQAGLSRKQAKPRNFILYHAFLRLKIPLLEFWGISQLTAVVLNATPYETSGILEAY